MKLPPTTEVIRELPIGARPDQVIKHIRDFVPIYKRLYERTSKVINGGVAIGNTASIDGAAGGGLVPCENIDGNMLWTAQNGQPDAVATTGLEYIFSHNLGRVPTGFLVINQIPADGLTPGLAFNGTTPWTKTQISLMFSAAGQYKILIF